MSVPQRFRDAAYPQETDDDVGLMVTIAHDDLAAPIHLTTLAGTWNEATNAYVLAVGGVTWISAAIDVDLPGETDGPPSGRLTVPNVDTRIGAALARIYTPATVTISAVLASDPTVVAAGPLTNLILRDVQGDAMSFQGELVRPDLTREPWPREWIRPARYRAAMKAVGR